MPTTLEERQKQIAGHNEVVASLSMSHRRYVLSISTEGKYHSLIVPLNKSVILHLSHDFRHDQVLAHG